jgi:cell division protein FtsB
MNKIAILAAIAAAYWGYTQSQRAQALTQQNERLSTTNKTLQQQLDALRINTPNVPSGGVPPTRDAGVTGA